MRRLLILASAMVFLDVCFYAAIAPLLPEYAHDLGLSKVAAGILSAAYAAGTLAGAIPAGFVASRVGPRRSTIVGLTMLGGASLVFGLAEQIVLLDLARFVQGCAGALIWAGALTWLISTAPEERRGSVIGSALGTSIAGALLGPALGALAASVGTGVVFGSVLGVSLILAALAWRTPDSAPIDAGSPREVVRTMLEPAIVRASIFVVVPSVMFGAIEVLVPLRIDSLSGGHTVIAAGFIVSAGIEAVLAPIAGRGSDRIGPRLLYVVGMAICALSMVVLAAAGSVATVIGSVLISALGAGICFTPAMALISDLAEASSLHQAFAVSLANLAWAAGQVIGGVGGGGVADVTGYAATSLAIAGLLVVTLLYAYRALEVRAGAEPAVGS